jgi:hypothetical protein
MINFLCLIVGLYIVIDAFFLASRSNGERRYCALAKYTGAMMSGLYFIFDGGSDDRLLFAGTIALFMWPETYFKSIQYLQIKAPKFYLSVIKHMNYSDRRKAEQ